MEGQEDFKQSISKLIKGGIILEVTTEEEAKIAEEAGVNAVVVVDWDDRKKDTGFMPDIYIIEQIKESVSIPIFVRIQSGQLVEAKLVENMNLAGIDEVKKESGDYELYKRNMSLPFINEFCHFDDLIQQIVQGTSILKNANKKESIHSIGYKLKEIIKELNYLITLEEAELAAIARKNNYCLEVLLKIKQEKGLPALLLANGLIKTPKDAAFLMACGADALMITYDIFKEHKVEKLLKALVNATFQYEKEDIILNLQKSISPLNEKTYVYKR